VVADHRLEGVGAMLSALKARGRRGSLAQPIHVASTTDNDPGWSSLRNIRQDLQGPKWPLLGDGARKCRQKSLAR